MLYHKERSALGHSSSAVRRLNWLVSLVLYDIMLALTPGKINIEPENDGLKDDFPF